MAQLHFDWIGGLGLEGLQSVNLGSNQEHLNLFIIEDICMGKKEMQRERERSQLVRRGYDKQVTQKGKSRLPLSNVGLKLVHECGN